jgi:hypothetical protein
MRSRHPGQFSPKRSVVGKHHAKGIDTRNELKEEVHEVRREGTVIMGTYTGASSSIAILV